MSIPTRGSLRDAVVGRLVAEVASFSGRVYPSRSLPVPGNAVDGGTAQFPCAMVYADRVTRDRRGHNVFDVYATIVVVVRVERLTTEQVEDDLDTISALVESALLYYSGLTDETLELTRYEEARQVSSEPERVAGADVHSITVRWAEVGG